MHVKIEGMDQFDICNALLENVVNSILCAILKYFKSSKFVICHKLPIKSEKPTSIKLKNNV